jgi:4-phosphopantoate--beta-alanine ligase
LVIDIPKDHPRRKSLIEREKIVEGKDNGLLAPVALIAHGRGEAFDYLINEKTTASAKRAIELAALALLSAKNPIISVNGNTAVLARESLWELAIAIPCPLEVNIFYRTRERMDKLLTYLSNDQVKILGKEEDARIPGLSSERSKCSHKGIFSADVVLVPLEDGDRCEALRKMGKFIIAIDLNPFSRTARTASLTIVDNVTRSINLLYKKIIEIKSDLENYSIKELPVVDNSQILREAIDVIEERLKIFKMLPLVQF